MRKEELELLLTTARILRAVLREESVVDCYNDVVLLTDALKPFDGIEAEPVNECKAP